MDLIRRGATARQLITGAGPGASISCRLSKRVLARYASPPISSESIPPSSTAPNQSETDPPTQAVALARAFVRHDTTQPSLISTSAPAISGSVPFESWTARRQLPDTCVGRLSGGTE